MPPKKRAKPNGFTCFASEIMRNSRDNLSFCQALARANPIWKEMDEAQRKPYHLMAKKEAPRKIDNDEKKNSEGIKRSIIAARVAQQDEERIETKRSIERAVLQSKKDNEFETKKYFFIAFNYFVRTGDVYVPAELSIAEFSLIDGVTRKYTTYINPSVDIYGRTQDAREHARNTHMLPLPPNAMGEKNLSVIYKHIMEFIGNDYVNNTSSATPVYTHKDAIEMVKSALTFLAVDDWNNDFELPVRSIHHLLFIMKEVACKIGELDVIKSHDTTDAYFERDEFEYQAGISCAYHEDLDRSKYCTQAMVTRWGYMFAKYMCNDIAIAMLPGRHFPKKIPIYVNTTIKRRIDKPIKAKEVKTN